MTRPKEVMTLYGRIATIIQSKIFSGQFNAGDKLPTEDELVEQYGVSKITIRGALAMLEAEGYITRTRGKGTFVADRIPGIRRSITSNLQESITAIGRASIKSVELGIIKIKSSRTPKDNRSFFGLEDLDDVFRVQRVVADGEILYFYENYLPAAFATHFSKAEIRKKRSIQRVLREKIGLKVTKGDMYIQAVPSEPDISEKIECQSFEPLIHTQAFFWHGEQQPFEITNVYFRSCYFRYKVELDITA